MATREVPPPEVADAAAVEVADPRVCGRLVRI
jgi:hypothetical protein